MDLLSKFASRKFLVAIVAILTAVLGTNEGGDLQHALITAAVAAVYIAAEAAIDHTGNTARLAAAVQSGIRIGRAQAEAMASSTTDATWKDDAAEAQLDDTPIPGTARGDGS